MLTELVQYTGLTEGFILSRSVAREIKCKGQECRTQEQFHKRRESEQIDDEGVGSCGSKPTVGFVAAEQK